MENQINNTITEEELARSRDIISKITGYYYERMVGQKGLGQSLLISMIANGHILLESVPGLAKTTAAKTLTDAVEGKFARIQCTPDLLPSDIIGTQIFNYSTNSFETKLGPVYANFVLLDEINRSSAKTQSAMLEVMQERKTTIGGVSYNMPDIFIVMATQNPIEQEGTYLLSEAQLDRFLIKEVITYPTVDEEFQILDRIEKNIFANTYSVVNIDDIKFLQNLCKRVYIDASIKKYCISIVDSTRHVKDFIKGDFAQYVNMGSSTRGSIALMEASKALALLRGRNYVYPDDVKDVVNGVLRHRISLNFAAMADGVKEEQIIEKLIGVIPAP